jgi:hypothetical protein
VKARLTGIGGEATLRRPGLDPLPMTHVERPALASLAEEPRTA